MKKRINKKGFTLVEIMIVVAIIALLAAIAIPNLLRAKISANDALAQGTLRSISTASETYATTNDRYPTNMTSLTGATPPYLQEDVCDGQPHSGFTFNCAGMTSVGYAITAGVVQMNSSGTTTWTISTGGILQEM